MMLKLVKFDKSNWKAPMKIYTKTGDKGETSLVDGKRVSKSHPRVEAYGTVDELNSTLGLCVAKLKALDERLKGDHKFTKHVQLLEGLQNTLFDIGSHLASEDPAMTRHLPDLHEERIAEMEQLIDETTMHLPPLKEFILPGGHEVSAEVHVARTLCRRSERRVVDLPANDSSGYAVRTLNRLSDYLFVLARWVNHATGSAEVKWSK